MEGRNGFKNRRDVLLTHIDKVAVVPGNEVAECLQLVRHVEDVLTGGIASANPHRLRSYPPQRTKKHKHVLIVCTLSS